MGRRDQSPSARAADEYRYRARMAESAGDDESAVDWERLAERRDQRVAEAERRRGR